MTHTKSAVQRLADQPLIDDADLDRVSPPHERVELLSTITNTARPAAEPTSRWRRRIRPLRLAAAAGAVAVLAAGALIASLVLPGAGAGGGRSANAATPPLLHFHPLASSPTASSLLNDLATKAAAQPAAPGHGRYEYVKTRGWYYNTRVADGHASGSLQPNKSEQWLAADGSGLTIIHREAIGQKDVIHGGRPLPDLSTEPGQLSQQLAHSHGGRSTAATFQAVTEVWGNQVIRPQVEAALLEVLAKKPNITVSGRVTDRAGRTGVAVSTISKLSGLRSRSTLIFEPYTGMLLDSEDVFLEAGALPIKPPAVGSYTQWLATGYTAATHTRPTPRN